MKTLPESIHSITNTLLNLHGHRAYRFQDIIALFLLGIKRDKS